MISPRRLWIVYALLAVLLGGHLYDAVRFQEHWPFSHYPMFAGIAQPELTTYQLIGLTGAQGVEREVPTYERSQLRAGMRISGYAIVEQYDATTVILPGHLAEVDPYLNLLITPEAHR